MKRHAIPVSLLLFAALQAADAKAPWPVLEKVRCLSYLHADEDSVGFVPRVRAMGFNCALPMLAGAPTDTLMPVISVADKAKLRLILVDYFDNTKYLADVAGSNARRYVAPDGRRVAHLPCSTVQFEKRVVQSTCWQITR